mmetsp:Transcript_19169/g.55707  ORF Transcript_19169/g.55707 Transcript_19169/m.55707 type:complete len:229 (+) Transcript_19169:1305-1991(+)
MSARHPLGQMARRKENASTRRPRCLARQRRPLRTHWPRKRYPRRSTTKPSRACSNLKAPGWQHRVGLAAERPTCHKRPMLVPRRPGLSQLQRHSRLLGRLSNFQKQPLHKSTKRTSPRWNCKKSLLCQAHKHRTRMPGLMLGTRKKRKKKRSTTRRPTMSRAKRSSEKKRTKATSMATTITAPRSTAERSRVRGLHFRVFVFRSSCLCPCSSTCPLFSQPLSPSVLCL